MLPMTSAENGIQFLNLEWMGRTAAGCEKVNGIALLLDYKVRLGSAEIHRLCRAQIGEACCSAAPETFASVGEAGSCLCLPSRVFFASYEQRRRQGPGGP